MKKILLPALAIALSSTTSHAGVEKDKIFEGHAKVIKSHVDYVLNPDATYTEAVEYMVKVLDKDAIDHTNTQSISFSNSMTDVAILEAYTLKEDGKRIEVPKENYQVESNSGEKGAAPMISDITTKSIIFPNVEVGDSIYMRYKFTHKEAMFPKQFSISTTLPDSYVIEDGELSITAPQSLPLKVETRDIAKQDPVLKDGKHTWIWHFTNNTLAKPQRGAVSSFDFAPRILVSTFKDYAELAEAYNIRAEPKSAVTEQVQKLADEITKDAKGDKETARLLYEWVSKHIRYAGNCIGIGSVVPHDVTHILNNKIGDCKDHTALLQALLAAKHIDSSPVLINSGAIYTLPEVPVPTVFNHVITYIPSLNIYADSTAEDIPFGMLPLLKEGKYAIQTKHFAGIKKTPSTDNTKVWEKTDVVLTVHDNGSVDGEMKVTNSGVFSIYARNWVQSFQNNPQHKEAMLKAMVADIGPKGTSEYIQLDDPNDTAETFAYKFKYHIDGAVNLPGPVAIYAYPFVRGGYEPIWKYVSIAHQDKDQHNAPCIGEAQTETVVIHLPKGIDILATPKDVHIKSQYGTYDSTYKQEGNTITSVRKIVDNSPSNVCTPDVSESFRPIAMAIEKDIKSQIILR